MSEEEKKAIEYWRYIRDTQIYDGYKGQVYAVALLNLIEKQQKELNQEKENSNTQYHLGFSRGQIEMNKTWEDKIREKIEELKNGTYDAKIILQNLLEE